MPRPDRFGTFTVLLFLLSAGVLLAGCGGSDGGTDPTPVATTITVTGGSITLSDVGETATISATVQDQNGQTISGAPLSYTSGNTSVATVSSSGVVTARGEGSTSVTLQSGSASATVPVSVTVGTLQSGAPLGNLSATAGDRRVFSFTVPAGSSDAVLEVVTSGGEGDVDLLVNFGSDPTNQDFDCDSFGSSTTEFCVIRTPESGEWRIALDAFDDYSGVTIRASTVDLQSAVDEVPITDLSAPGGTFRYFEFDVPISLTEGRSPSASAQPTRADKENTGAGLLDRAREVDQRAAPEGANEPLQTSHVPTLTATTSGGTGDVDLIGTSAAFLSNTSPLACLSVNDGSDEECVVENPTSGPWTYMLLPFTAYDGATFTVDYDDGTGTGPSTGTLTVQKGIQSFSGGTPDNPTNPALDGFVFEIRPAGGGSVAATVTTDASGVAQATLPAGSWDVTETFDKGLTDVTVAVDGVAVPQGGNVDVAWVNRQADPSAGNGTPVARIEAAPVAVPSGDNNQTEVRLYAGNSTDPDGDVLTYTWSAAGGTFIDPSSGVATRVTFPGGSSQTIALMVSDGQDQSTAQVQIPGPSPLPAAGTLNIELVPISPIDDPAAQAAFDLAEATWESIVRNELPDVNFANQPFDADQCPLVEGVGTITDVVDDVRIYIEFAPDDGPGGTLAAAGPCLVRTTGIDTPIIGNMKFDSDDFGDLSASTLNRVILHEMAHVLGLGTLWGRNEQLENPSCPGQSCEPGDPPGPDTRFTGAAASRAYRALGGIIDANVPVENERGGSGTRDGHWRESIFGRELMTGFLANNVQNPLSILTVGALEDNGYLVDYSQVDDYSIPGDAPFPVAGEPGVLDLRGDLYIGPMWGLEEDGTIVLIRSGR